MKRQLYKTPLLNVKTQYCTHLVKNGVQPSRAGPQWWFADLQISEALVSLEMEVKGPLNIAICTTALKVGCGHLQGRS